MLNDNLQQQLCLIYENMMCKAQYGNIEGTFTVASKLTDVVTGKEDANFASPMFTGNNHSFKVTQM